MLDTHKLYKMPEGAPLAALPVLFSRASSTSAEMFLVKNESAILIIVFYFIYYLRRGEDYLPGLPN